jgi:hypothetical protein
MFDPGIEKPAFPAGTPRDVFVAKLQAIYGGLSLEEIKSILTPKQAQAVELVFFERRISEPIRAGPRPDAVQLCCPASGRG